MWLQFKRACKEWLSFVDNLETRLIKCVDPGGREGVDAYGTLSFHMYKWTTDWGLGLEKLDPSLQAD